jgi:hypothetical protein
MKNKWLSIVCASFITIVYTHVSLAENVCSQNTLNGRYLYSSSGKDASGFDYSNAGLAHYDGNGNITDLSSNNGNTAVIKIIGTYELKSECTGTIHISTYDSHYNIFASPDGSRVTFVQTDAGTNISGQENRVAP